MSEDVEVRVFPVPVVSSVQCLVSRSGVDVVGSCQSGGGGGSAPLLAQLCSAGPVRPEHVRGEDSAHTRDTRHPST